MRSARAGFALLVLALSLVAAANAHGLVGANPVPPSVAIETSRDALSPNGDGIDERVRIAVRVDQAARIVVAFEHQGKVLFTSRTFVTSHARTIRLVWKGRTRLGERGKLLPDGRYLIRATATGKDSLEGTASTRLLIDTRPPVVRWRTLAPRRVRRSPIWARGRVRDRMAEIRIGLSLADQAGNPLRASPPRPRPARSFALRFPQAGRMPLLPGAYRVAIRAIDELGNATVSSERPFLVDHPVHPRVWGRFRRVGRRVALTFDDCNSRNAWSSILRTLHRYAVTATFFCPGQQVRASPGLARRTVAAGHLIGSHGWDHANFAALSYGAAQWRLAADRETWWRLARVAPTPYFRPPYGAYTGTTVAAAGMEGYAAVVLWDVDPRDWSSPGTATIIHRVLSRTHAGSIVLMHVVPQTAAGLSTILRGLRAKRLRPVSLADLARIGTPSPAGWRSY